MDPAPTPLPAETLAGSLSSGARDTIVAIATPPGRGGIGILRLSGPDAVSIAAPLLRLRAPLEHARARFCEIIDPVGAESIPGNPARSAVSAAGPISAELAPVPAANHLPPAVKLDEAIATYYAAPHSYTGEHVLEIAAHGSPVLLDFLLRQTTARGARLANPGEFTERAFLSGRLDLTQAEAVRDLIDAQTLYQARIAASQLDGALSRRVAPIKTALIALIAQLEAGIDFAEDDTPTLSSADILARSRPIADQLEALARSFEHGRLVQSGLTLAIIGEPNVGKSSLFNRLVERERAIVTAAPGTTRDLVTERISLGGIPVELVDTAGLRTASPSGDLDEAERLGIEKSRQALADADLVLLVLDATILLPRALSPPLSPGPASAAPSGIRPSISAKQWIADTDPAPDPSASTSHEQPSEQLQSCSSVVATANDSRQPAGKQSREQTVSGVSPQTARLLASLKGRHTIIIINKCDLLPTEPVPPAPAANRSASMTAFEQLQQLLQTPDLQSDSQQSRAHIEDRVSPIILTSAQTGQGLAELRRAIESHLQAPASSDQAGLLTNLRQHQAVAAAHSAVTTAITAAPLNLPHEMLLLDLYTALRHLDTLTGETTSDDILHLIFSTFCIGK